MHSDQNARETLVAEYTYRHEAEFAAGFLSDAGIPYRLQVDDAGGAELGATIARPARLWVRADHAEEARELLEIPLPSPGTYGENATALELVLPRPATGSSDATDLPRPTPVPEHHHPGSSERAASAASELGTAERAAAGLISLGLAGAGYALGSNATSPGLGVVGVGVLIALAIAFAAFALLGRAWGIFRTLLHTLTRRAG